LLSRRRFGLSIAAFTEAALAQRHATSGAFRRDMVWLNANENPEGPCGAALAAMAEALPQTGRYHFQEFGAMYAAIAAGEGLAASQVLVGAGSSEILHAAIDAFTAADRPLVTMDPTFELPGYVAEALGRNVVRVPLSGGYFADVKRLAGEAAKHRAGAVYVCNPNNPTSALTPPAEIDWLAGNLPDETVLLLDEAYMHFTKAESGLKHVRAGKNVVVARTFSKIYGMAGMRIGCGCAKPELIARMQPFRDSVISYASAKGAVAAVAEGRALVDERRTRLANVRSDLCGWLSRKGIRHIEPHGNFVMMDIGRDVREFGRSMAGRGVAVGRPFPPLHTMLRVTVGTEAQMARFRSAFEQSWV
jgi:histidinol-phosphate aminotransferase